MQALLSKLTKVPNSLWVLVGGGLLLFPQLGSYGLWDPIEIQNADIARDVLEQKSFHDVTVGGKHGLKPYLFVWLVAWGFQLFGINELAGRIPLAMTALVGLLLVYRVGARVFNARVGLCAALVLGTTPMFLFQGRQITGDMVYVTSLIAAVGGFAAFLWSGDGKRSIFDLLIGTSGLIAGLFAKGLLLGVLFPLLSFVVALTIATPRTCANSETSSENSRSSSIPWPLLLGALGAVGLVALVSWFTLTNTAFLLWGGVVHKLSSPPHFAELFRDLNFGIFPWGVFALFALFFFTWEHLNDELPPTNQHVFKLLLVIVASLGYAATYWFNAFIAKSHFVGLPWLMFAAALLLYETFQRRKIPLAWVPVFVFVMLALRQDFSVEPQSLAFSHLVEQAKFPIEVALREPLRRFGIVGVLLGLLIVAVPPLRFALWRKIVGNDNERLWLIGGVAAFGFSAWCVWFVTPALSAHMSNKALFQTYHRCRASDSTKNLAQYQVHGRAAAYYNDGHIEQLMSQSQLFDWLRKPEQTFVLVASSSLAQMDQAARSNQVPYYVVDDSNAHFLLVSNRLAGECGKDQNPLHRFVTRTRPTPQKRLNVEYDSRVELIGYDLPDVVTSGGKFKITLYFHVLQKVPGGYKLFMHFDKPAGRFHGDHDPINGKYPTQYWLPGDYIIDEYEIELPLLTTSPGTYQIYTGFWQGSKRLKITKGANDGSDRANIGQLKVSLVP